MSSIMRTTTSRVGIAVITAIVTTAVIAGGVAAASVPNNSVTSAKIRTGAVTTPKIKNGAVTSAKIANGAVTSAKIATGAVGASEIADGSIYEDDLSAPVVNRLPRWASVSANVNEAFVLNSRGVSSAQRLDIGQYRVTFPQSIEFCAVTATLSDTAVGQAAPGEITVERDSATQVRVRTYNSAGNPADRAVGDGFMITAFC